MTPVPAPGSSGAGPVNCLGGSLLPALGLLGLARWRYAQRSGIGIDPRLEPTENLERRDPRPQVAAWEPPLLSTLAAQEYLRE